MGIGLGDQGVNALPWMDRFAHFLDRWQYYNLIFRLC
jgi:hypothetical protein